MPSINPLELVLLISGLVAALFICFMYPNLGLIVFMSIYLLKPILLNEMRWLTGAVGYMVDMGTVLLAGFSLWAYHLRNPSPKRSLAPTFIYICLLFLAMWIWFRYPATRLPSYGIKKALIFSIFDVSVVLLGMHWAKGVVETQKILRSLFFLGIFISIWTVFFGRATAEYTGARTTFVYSNPLAPAEFGAYLIVVSVCYWFSEHTARRALIAVVLSLLGLAAVFITGSRGPILIMPLVILAVLYFYRRTVNVKAAIQVMLVLGVLYVAFTVIKQQAVVEARFESRSIMAGLEDRVIMVKNIMSGWLNNPIFGTGPGDTSIQIGSETEGYPHNVVLEVLNELGLIGIVPFLFLIFSALAGWRYLSSEFLEGTYLKRVYVPIWACFFLMFINSFKSGSFAGSNMFYFFMGASISLGQLCKQSLEYPQWSDGYYNEYCQEMPSEQDVYHEQQEAY